MELRTEHPKTFKPIAIKGTVRRTESGSMTPVKPHMKNMLVNAEEPGSAQSKLTLSPKVVLDRRNAEGYVSKSQYRLDAYHTLPSDRVEGIMQKGFEMPKKSGFGRDWGDGIYLSASDDVANHYNEVLGSRYNNQGRNAEELVVKLDTRKPLNVDVSKMPSDCNSNSQKRFEWMTSLMQDEHPDVDVNGIFQNEVSKVRTKESQAFTKASKLYPAKTGMNQEQRDGLIAQRVDWLKKEGYGGGYEPYAAAFSGTAKKMGYDSVVVKDGNKTNQLVALKPNKIRIVDERRVPNKIAPREKMKLTKRT